MDEQDGIQTRSQGQRHVQNNDIVGIFSYNIFVGIAVATIFGSGFFFDLFWPERHESTSVKWAWKISSIVVSFMALADAIALTVRDLGFRLSFVLIHDPRSLLPHVVLISPAYQMQMQRDISARTVNRIPYTARTHITLLRLSVCGPVL